MGLIKVRSRICWMAWAGVRVAGAGVVIAFAGAEVGVCRSTEAAIVGMTVVVGAFVVVTTGGEMAAARVVWLEVG
jgi:hypothetical protein